MKKAFSLIALMCALAACAPKMDPKEVTRTVLAGKGIFAGISLGDTWESVKASHDPSFEVLEKPAQNMRELRRQLESLNYWFVSFDKLDPAGKITMMSMSVSGTEKNSVVVRQLNDEFLSHFERRFGKPNCNGSSCNFELPNHQQMTVSYGFDDKLNRGNLDVRVVQ